MAKKITEDGEIVDIDVFAAVPKPAPFFKTPWNHDTDLESAAAGLTCRDPSKTQQQFASDADINVILAKFMQTGELNLTGAPIYQDVEEEFDLQTNMITTHQVDEAWSQLPQEARELLGTPARLTAYVDACLARGDIEALRKLGLANPAKPPEVSAEPKTTTTPDPAGGVDKKGAPAP